MVSKRDTLNAVIAGVGMTSACILGNAATANTAEAQQLSKSAKSVPLPPAIARPGDDATPPLPQKVDDIRKNHLQALQAVRERLDQIIGDNAKATADKAPQIAALPSVTEEKEQRLDSFNKSAGDSLETLHHEEALTKPSYQDGEKPKAAEFTGKAVAVPLPVMRPKTEDLNLKAVLVSTKLKDRKITVKRGNTIGKIMDDLGLDADQRREALAGLKKIFKPRALRIGQVIKAKTMTQIFKQSGVKRSQTTLLNLEIAINDQKTVHLHRTEFGDLAAFTHTRQLNTEIAYGSGLIKSSLLEAGSRENIPSKVLYSIMNTMSHQVDFQRAIQKGDRFEILYERIIDPETGETVRSGDVIYARLRASGKDFEIYRHETANKRVGYFDAEGRSIQQMLMRTPTDATRISSGFGWRKHPVLGYTKLHKGVDFAAPKGTRIYAAGHGVIERRGWVKGYGRYILIRHSNGYKTAYAHMSAFKRGLKVGSRVSQGQVIGFVGRSGRVTGNHLHYEVIRNGKHLNPLKVKTAAGYRLAKNDLKKFKSVQGKVAKQVLKKRNIALVSEVNILLSQENCRDIGVCFQTVQR